jgi:hypothetical protein
MKHICTRDPDQRAPQRRARRSELARLPRLALVAMLGALLGIPCFNAQNSKPGEYEVKAAYLDNFGRFVEWPAKVSPSKDHPLTVCVFGRDPFGPILDATLAGESVNGSNVVSRRISKIGDAENCHILFISSSEVDQLKEILAALDKVSILTVSEIPRFARHGGMIEFVLDGSKVRFEVNLAVAERAGLSLSSQLLKVALRVRTSAQPGV